MRLHGQISLIPNIADYREKISRVQSLSLNAEALFFYAAEDRDAALGRFTDVFRRLPTGVRHPIVKVFTLRPKKANRPPGNEVVARNQRQTKARRHAGHANGKHTQVRVRAFRFDAVFPRTNY